MGIIKSIIWGIVIISLLTITKYIVFPYIREKYVLFKVYIKLRRLANKETTLTGYRIMKDLADSAWRAFKE